MYKLIYLLIIVLCTCVVFGVHKPINNYYLNKYGAKAITARYIILCCLTVVVLLIAFLRAPSLFINNHETYIPDIITGIIGAVLLIWVWCQCVRDVARFLPGTIMFILNLIAGLCAVILAFMIYSEIDERVNERKKRR